MRWLRSTAAIFSEIEVAGAAGVDVLRVDGELVGESTVIEKAVSLVYAIQTSFRFYLSCVGNVSDTYHF